MEVQGLTQEWGGGGGSCDPKSTFVPTGEFVPMGPY